ncbi:MAG TPA: hypothetical protein VJ837_06150, partial [Candidatus Paceibacterota bacterium]|nr:hypothetical protein [Candidatus Paceibacterota bacterium]
MEERRQMNKHLARNIIEATADKERLNDWDKDQLRWVARSLDSLEETEYVSTDHNPDPYTPPNHKWVIDYAGRKETCSVCGAIEPLSTKLSYRVNIGGRNFFVSGYDVDDAIGMAVAMARIEGLTEPIKSVDAEKLDI